MIVVRGLGAGRLLVVRRMVVFLCAGPEFDGADLSGSDEQALLLCDGPVVIIVQLVDLFNKDVSLCGSRRNERFASAVIVWLPMRLSNA